LCKLYKTEVKPLE